LPSRIAGLYLIRLAGLGRPDRNRSGAFIWAAVLLKLGEVVGTISTWLWNDVVGKFST
jgi:hypothetical protein